MKSESEIAQSCLTLCNPMGCSLLQDSPGKSTGMGCHFLLQGIFPTQGSNRVLPPCRQTLYPLSHQETKKKQQWRSRIQSGNRGIFLASSFTRVTQTSFPLCAHLCVTLIAPFHFPLFRFFLCFLSLTSTAVSEALSAGSLTSLAPSLLGN